MYFDTHCHLNLIEDADDALGRALKARVAHINNVGTDLQTSIRAVQYADAHAENVIASVGVHPTDGQQIYTSDGQHTALSKLGELLRNPIVKALGEVGLDYFHLDKTIAEAGVTEDDAKKYQKDFLIECIKLAKSHNKSLIFHCRDAYEDFYDILKNSLAPNQMGVMHFYIGSQGTLKKFLDLGLYIGYSGVVTYPKTENYAENILNTPLNRILIETDSPFAAPQAYRGKKNEPAYVVEVARKIAEIKNLPLETVAEQTLQNAKKLFNM